MPKRTRLCIIICIACWTAIFSLPAGADEAVDSSAATATTQADSIQDAATATVIMDQEVQPPSIVGWLELSGSLRDGPLSFAWVIADDTDASLSDVIGQLQTVAQGEQYLGVVVYLDRPRLNLTQVGVISKSIAKVRAAGKRVLTFSQEYDTLGYLLASAGDLVLLQHHGSVALRGLSAEEMYLAGLLEKIGVKADLMQIGQFKGADEALTRSEPSEAWSQNIDALLDNLYSQIVGQIASGRNLSVQEVEAIIGESWAMRDNDYLRRRVVDRLTDRDLVDVTEVEFGDNFVWDDTMGKASGAAGTVAASPFALFQQLFTEPASQTRRPTIAMIHCAEPITSSDSTIGDGMFSRNSIGSRTLNRIFAEIAADDNIQGVILRIDSPGGSALASEIIWQALRQLSEAKPVFVSIGAMAASGGYYIAIAGDEIYLSEQSIVGSIGVVSGKIVIGDLYEKIGVNVVRRSRGPNADMFNSVEPFTPEQRQAVKAAMQRIYDEFTQRVVTGRSSRLPDINAVAEGRLFTGRQALANGMADKIGDADSALTDMAGQLNLKSDEYDVLHLPTPVSFMEYINKMFSTRAAPVDAQRQAAIAVARHLLGDWAWQQVSRTLDGLLLLQHEPIRTLMPTALIIR